MRILGYLLGRKQILTAHGEDIAPTEKPYRMYINIGGMPAAGNINGQWQQLQCLQALANWRKFGLIIIRALD